MNRIKQSLSSLPAPSLPSFGSSSPEDEDRPTQAPLDRERLAALAVRRDVAGNLADTFAQHVRALQKERSNPVPGSGNATALASQWVGEAMVAGAQVVRAGAGSATEATYAHVLASTGELYLQFTKLAASYHDQLSANYLDALERRADDFKDLDKTAKEAEKKRSLLEAVMTKMEKGKKDPAEYERDLENAEDVYADECRRLQRKADRLEEALEADIDSLKQLVAVQLDYARRYVALLEDCESSIGSLPSAYSSRPRSSTLQAPPSSTRMARSQSESSVLSVPTPATSSSSGMFSMLGPNRSRRSTVSSQTSDGAGAPGAGAGAGSEPAKNRSRSGSMLERFALNKNKKKDPSPAETPTVEETEDARELPRTSSSSGASSPTRSRIAPSMPTIGSFKKLSLSGAGSGKYGTLGEDADDPSPRAPSPTHSPTSSTASFSSRRLPPMLRRAETAPAVPTLQQPSPSSRRAVPFPVPVPAPRPPPVPSRGPVGKTYRAQWAYVPAAPSAGHAGTDEGDDEDELELELVKGDVVRVVREVNADWWIGTLVAVPGGWPRSDRRCQTGMFPSAYVVPCDDPTAAAERDASARWTNLSNHSSASTHDGYGDSSGHGHSAAGDSEDDDDDDDGDEDGEEGLLDGPALAGEGGGGSSPFDDAPRGTKPPLPERRGSAADGPFASDGVSHVRVAGQLSRRA